MDLYESCPLFGLSPWGRARPAFYIAFNAFSAYSTTMRERLRRSFCSVIVLAILIDSCMGEIVNRIGEVDLGKRRVDGTFDDQGDLQIQQEQTYTNKQVAEDRTIQVMNC